MAKNTSAVEVTFKIKKQYDSRAFKWNFPEQGTNVQFKDKHKLF